MTEAVAIERRKLLLAVGSGLVTGVAAGVMTETDVLGNLFDRLTGVGSADVGGPFRLITHDGTMITDRDLRGRPMIVLFGYIADADQTPALLQLIVAARGKVGSAADRIATILITLDPGNDNPTNLKKFLTKYGDHILGLTGPSDAVFATAKAYRLPLARSIAANRQPAGPIEFEPLIYFMNRRGKYVTHLSLSAGVDRVANVIRNLL